VGAENRHRARRNLGQALDETGALGFEAFDDMAVVDDLVAHIDGCAEPFERAFHDLDRPDDTCTEAPRLCQDDFHDQAPNPVAAALEGIRLANKACGQDASPSPFRHSLAGRCPNIVASMKSPQSNQIGKNKLPRERQE
jgi:hypothetical protein